jgi:hypothetical protein
MLAHALTIVINELNRHLVDVYAAVAPQAALGNLSEGFATGLNNGGNARDMLYLSVVNIKEEKTLKNVPTYVRNDAALTVSYENPPVFVNGQILLTATHGIYSNALTVLSRAIRFFQLKNMFTQENVNPASITTNQPANPLDQLESFKLIFDFYSPTMEEVNHLWGTLGGKQYPFAMYMLRMLELKFNAVQSESGLITEVVSDFVHKNVPAN